MQSDTPDSVVALAPLESIDDSQQLVQGTPSAKSDTIDADVVRMQMQDSLRLYRVLQGEVNDTIASGMSPTLRMVRVRSTALREYLECATVLQRIKASSVTADAIDPNATLASVDDAYRMLSDETLAQLVREIEASRRDT